MRSLILFVALAALMSMIIVAPYVGVLIWSWVSFNNPHREVWGFATNLPFVMVAAVLTIVGWAFSRKEKKEVLNDRTFWFMAIFLAWTGLTTFTALDRAWSAPIFTQTAKTFVLAAVVIGLANSKVRIQALLWVIAISIGYYAVRGTGVFVLSGGHSRVYGPDSSMISDNNTLGLALVMIVPILNYLRLSSRGRLASMLATGLMVTSAIAIVGTYSRGALFGLALVASALWFRSRQKISIAFGVLALAIALQSAIPPQWFQRMETIGQYASDESFEGRMGAWHVALRMAADRPLVGGGYSATLQGPIFEKYRDPGSTQPGTAAHSILFEVLGDHGYVGLTLYALMVTIAWFNLLDVGRLVKGMPQFRWADDLVRGLQVSFIGFLAGGALLSMAYYDAFIVLLALTGALRTLVTSAIHSLNTEEAPDWQRVPQLKAWHA